MDDVLQQILSELKEIKVSQAVAEQEIRKTREKLNNAEISRLLADKDRAVLEQGINRINDRLNTMQEDITGLKETDASIPKEMTGLTDSDNVILRDITRLNHTIEPQLQIITEGIKEMQENRKRVAQLETKADNHDDRIWALEQVV